MRARKVLAAAFFVSACFVAACASDSMPVAPSSTSISAATEPRAEISGRVTGRDTGAGIAGAIVNMDAPSTTGASVLTDASGFYSLAVKGGHVTVAVVANGFFSSSRIVDVTAHDDARLDFQLAPTPKQ
jgi:carboxypeptidase family protein